MLLIVYQCFLVKHPCMINNGGCEHICVTAYKNKEAIAQCLCQPGYRLTSGKCVGEYITIICKFIFYILSINIVCISIQVVGVFIIWKK